MTHTKRAREKVSRSARDDSEAAATWPGLPTESPTGSGQARQVPHAAMPRDHRHGDLRLTPEGGRHMVLRKGRVEMGNCGWVSFWGDST
jgi:hypothetical protein